MAWFADLTPCTYFNPDADTLLAVGWLEGDHQFTRGPIDQAVVDRFAEMIWNQGRHFPAAFLGGHGCTLCDAASGQPQNSDGSRTIASYDCGLSGMRYNGVKTDVGIRNLFVPGKGVLYVAPSLMLHYMVDHGYAPPQEFCEALLSCPPIGSEEYYEAFERNCPVYWHRWAQRRGAREPVKKPVIEERMYKGVVTLQEIIHVQSGEHTAAHVPAAALDCYVSSIIGLVEANYTWVSANDELEVEVDLTPNTSPTTRLSICSLRHAPLFMELHKQITQLPPIYAERQPVSLKLEFLISAEGAPTKQES